MQSTNIPTKIPLPFANSAGVGYITAIPVTSQIGIVDGRASLHDGFPPLNFTAISSGGVPPFGADVNGILFESTAILQWQQAGGFFPYDSAFSSTVGGYPLGAVIQAAAFSGFWTSTSENNTTNPDTGGAGWIPTAFSGLQSIPLSGASVTLTNLQSAYPIIVLTGALTQNCNVIVSNFVGDWIFVNNTTGAYTVQVKTAAGTGVNIAQNASQYVWGDATNIYYANASSVTSFNTRTGAITLTALDVTNALGYVPLQYAVTTLAGGTTGLTPASATNGAITLAGTLVSANGGTGLASAGTTGNMLVSNSGVWNSVADTSIGYGQTWQNVSASRALNVTYTNSTGKPIEVNVMCTGGQNTTVDWFIGSTSGVKIARFYNATVSPIGSTCSFIVPPGSSYIGTPLATGGYFDFWSELR